MELHWHEQVLNPVSLVSPGVMLWRGWCVPELPVLSLRLPWIGGEHSGAHPAASAQGRGCGGTFRLREAGRACEEGFSACLGPLQRSEPGAGGEGKLLGC